MAHRKERTEKLHTAFNTLSAEEALKVGLELGYTAAGAKSWFAWWKNHSTGTAKATASVAKPVTKPAEKPAAPAPVAPVDADRAKKDARNKKRREARAAKKNLAVAA